MDLYEEHGGHFDSSNSASSLPDLTHSMNSSLSSTSSWDCSVIGTPPSTRRTSFDSVKLEDMSVSCHTPTPSRTPERYGSATGFYQVPNMSQKTINSFQDQDMMFGRALSNQSFLGCQQTSYSGPMYSSFGSSDGLPNQYSSFSAQSISTSQPQAISFHGFSSSTPSLEMDLYSPASAMSSSPVSGGYVEPSQTTFVDTFDMSSPMGQVRSLQFDSPLSEPYGSSPPGRQSQLQYFMSPSHSSEHHSSPTSTPSREPTQRQRTFQPLSSATALHRIQASRGSEPRISRESRRRTGQKTSDRVVLPANVSIQNKAKRHCTWPGCQGRFQRQEHLKRHMKTHEDAPKVACQFCSKAFGRADNLKSHIKLHADPNKKSSRTDYFPKAQEVWEEMSRKSRKLGSQQ